MHTKPKTKSGDVLLGAMFGPLAKNLSVKKTPQSNGPIAVLFRTFGFDFPGDHLLPPARFGWRDISPRPAPANSFFHTLMGNLGYHADAPRSRGTHPRGEQLFRSLGLDTSLVGDGPKRTFPRFREPRALQPKIESWMHIPDRVPASTPEKALNHQRQQERSVSR